MIGNTRDLIRPVFVHMLAAGCQQSGTVDTVDFPHHCQFLTKDRRVRRLGRHGDDGLARDVSPDEGNCCAVEAQGTVQKACQEK